MTIIRCGLLAMALLTPAATRAQPADATRLAWTAFIDPTENAFAFDVPQGWTVAGGTKRIAPILAAGWVTARSPDGAMRVFVGDPGIPSFTVPPANQPEGAQIPSSTPDLPPTVALRYHPGAAFAAFHGPRTLAMAGCQNAVVTDTRPMPDLARVALARATEQARGLDMSGPYTPPPHDAGIALFTCQGNDGPMAAGLIADTTQPFAMGQPFATGRWSVSVIAGYLAPPGQADWARAILEHILASRRWNPQWDRAMHEQVQEVLHRQNQQGAEARAQMQLQSQMFTNQILAQGQVAQQGLMANHQAYMARMDAQSAQNTARFNQYMAGKGLAAWQFQAYIRNGALYRDPRTGRIFEVDP